MSRLWVIIPTYNERANLAELLPRLFSLQLPLQMLVVDDASPDGTAELVRELAAQHTNLHLLARSGKQGLGSAYRAGFDYALERGAAVVGEMDADLSHLPEDLPRLAAALEAGAQVAIGSRRVPGGSVVGWGPGRRLMSWGANTLSRRVLGLATHDVTAGFRLYSRAALESVPWRQVGSDGYAWQEEVLCLMERSGVAITEVPVVFNDRTRGRSKLGFKQVVDFFVTLVRLRFHG